MDENTPEIAPKKSGLLNRKSFFSGKSKSKSSLNENNADIQLDVTNSNANSEVDRKTMIAKPEENKKDTDIAKDLIQPDLVKEKLPMKDVEKFVTPQSQILNIESLVNSPIATKLKPATITPVLSTPIVEVPVPLATTTEVIVERGISTLSYRASVIEAAQPSAEALETAPVIVELPKSTIQSKVGPKSGRFFNAMDIAAIESRRKPDAEENSSQVVSKPLAEVATAKTQAVTEPAAVILNNNGIKPELSSNKLSASTNELAKSDLKSSNANLLDQKPKITEADSEKILSQSVKVTWKDHKCEIKVTNFELHCFEEGKTKPFKPYLPISLRQIICLSVEKASQVLITCVIHPKGELTGKEFKTILLIFSNAAAAQQWCDHMINLTFGGGYEEFVKKEILILVEKSDRDSQKMVDKYVTEVLQGSKRPFKVEGTNLL